MQVFALIVQRVAVNVMNDLPLCGSGYLAMLPISARPLAAVSEAQASLLLSHRVAIRFFHSGVGGDGMGNILGRPDHLVTAPIVFTRRKPAYLRLVGVERVAVLSRHLVVAPAHFLGDHRALAVETSAANDLAAPSVVRRSMPLLALVMHQAKPVGGVFPFTSGDVACSHAANDNSYQNSCPYKALGNSWACTNGAWILARLARLLERKDLAA